MKILISSFIILLLSSASVSAQKYLFRMHRFYCSELFGIELTKPKELKVIDGLTPFKMNQKRRVGMFYQMSLISKAKDCLILFPCFDAYPRHNITTRSMVYGEVEAVLGLKPDKVFKIHLPEPYKVSYSECIGINAIKKGYPSAMMKILLTEEGKTREEEYMRLLFQ